MRRRASLPAPASVALDASRTGKDLRRRSTRPRRRAGRLAAWTVGASRDRRDADAPVPLLSGAPPPGDGARPRRAARGALAEERGDRRSVLRLGHHARRSARERPARRRHRSQSARRPRRAREDVDRPRAAPQRDARSRPRARWPGGRRRQGRASLGRRGTAATQAEGLRSQRARSPPRRVVRAARAPRARDARDLDRGPPRGRSRDRRRPHRVPVRDPLQGQLARLRYRHHVGPEEHPARRGLSPLRAARRDPPRRPRRPRPRRRSARCPRARCAQAPRGHPRRRSGGRPDLAAVRRDLRLRRAPAAAVGLSGAASQGARRPRARPPSAPGARTSGILCTRSLAPSPPAPMPPS